MHSFESQPGKYIVIEGADGSGKGTQCELAVDYLSAKGLYVQRTIEPGGTTIGTRIREVLKYERIERHPKTDVDLLTASRRESAIHVIRPALQSGGIVLADRSHLSTIAYQGFGMGVPIDYIVERSKDAIGELYTPDLALVLKVPYELLQERMLSRGGIQKDYYESKGADFFKRVSGGYDWICENMGVTVIDGSTPLDTVWADVQKNIDQEMEANYGI